MGIMTKTVDGRFRPLQAESKRVQRRKYKRNTKGTYIGLLTSIIQDSPNKMLTFRQIMDKLTAFVSGDRKGLENNIRVCLSSNKCFAKVPVDPEYPNAKRNFWRVDEGCITRKMLRRHFSNSVAMLPEFSQRNMETSVLDAQSTVCRDTVSNRSVKFRSSFSIESLLKNDRISIRDSSHHTDVPEECRFYGAEETVVRIQHLDEENNFTTPCAICNSGIWKCPLEMVDLAADHNRALYPPHWFYNQTFSNLPLFSLGYVRW